MVPDAWENVAFGVTGDGVPVGRNPYASEAGIASILVDTQPGKAPVSLHALALGRAGERARILGATLAMRRGGPGHRLVYTTDGTPPGAASPRYRGPIEADPRLQAGLVVEGRVVATLAADVPKFRIPPSAPPERREPFHR